MKKESRYGHISSGGRYANDCRRLPPSPSIAHPFISSNLPPHLLNLHMLFCPLFPTSSRSTSRRSLLRRTIRLLRQRTVLKQERQLLERPPKRLGKHKVDEDDLERQKTAVRNQVLPAGVV